MFSGAGSNESEAHNQRRPALATEVEAMTTELKTDRIGVLASTVIKELAAARVKEIEAESVEPVEPPIVVTAAMARLVATYDSSRKAAKATEDAIEKLGYRFSSSCGSKTKVERPYVRHDERRERMRAHRAERARRVREMRAEALIDLIALDPSKAKAAVKAFKAGIEAV